VELEQLSAGALLLKEYERLKEEQLQRIGIRDNLVYATLVSLGAVVAATIQTRSRAALLLLPPVCVILGWTYLVNDEKVSAIGRYIRLELGPRLAQLVEYQPMFGWEVFHRNDLHRRPRKVGQLLVDLTTFVLPSILAVIGYWRSNGISPTELFVISIVELAATIALAWQVIRYADLSVGTAGRDRRDLP